MTLTRMGANGTPFRDDLRLRRFTADSHRVNDLTDRIGNLLGVVSRRLERQPSTDENTQARTALASARALTRELRTHLLRGEERVS